VGIVLLATSQSCGWLKRPTDAITAPFRAKQDVALAEMGVHPVDAALLAKDDWVLAQPDPARQVDPALPHYINPTVEPIFALSGSARPNLMPALDHPDAPVRANAAIGLARWGDGRALTPLVTIVGEVPLKLNLRRAAAESLGNITQPSPREAIRTLHDRFGRFEPSNLANYSPELHADLLRALSRHVDAAADTRFLESLRAPGVDARKEALAAWGRSAATNLPPDVVDLRADPNPEIRAAAISMLLAKRHPQALDFAKNALQDFDTNVRCASAAGLGRYGGDDAIAQLDRVMLQEGEVLREAAVEGLHAAGALDKVWAAANDKAWRVRRAVAQCIAHHPEPRTAALAYQFLADDSGEVRKTIVASLDAWPLPTAGPVLLAALKEPTFETRRLAGEQLTRRWPPAAEFTVDLPLERRNAVVAALESRWSTEFGAFDPAMFAAAAAAANLSTAYTLTPQRLDALQQIVDACAREQASDRVALHLGALGAFGPDVVDALERLLLERGVVPPEPVYRQFLVSKAPPYAALDQLTAADVNDRRRGADRLAELAREAPLRPLVTSRIAQLGTAEADGLVWRGLSEAMASDRTEASMSLALAGLSHPSPEVRRMACELLAARPEPRHAQTLLVAAADPHVGVATAAVKALAHPGLLPDPSVVENLLTSRDSNLRFEAARTLHANGFAAGAAAWERLAHDVDPELRRRAASAMGESGDRQFLPTLIALLNDPALGVRKTAVDGLAALIGNDVSVAPGEPLPALSERIARWQAWYARQR